MEASNVVPLLALASQDVSLPAIMLPVGAAVVVFMIGLALVSGIVQRTWAGQTLGRYGPVKWLFLFASGAKLDLLRKCPSEETNYVGLGSAVVITSSAAVFSSIVALTVALGPTGSAWPRYVPFGLAYGTAIFLLDRFLVSAQLNPFRLPGVTGIPAGKRDAKAALREVGRTLLAAFPRFLFAVVIAFLIAEPPLLVVFNDEIEGRVGLIRTDLQNQAETKVRASHQQALDKLEKTTPIDLDGDGVNDIDSTERDLSSVQDQLTKVDQDIDRKSALLDEETRQGVVKVGGQQTTGIAGCGPRCRELQTAIKLDREQRSDLEQRQQELDTKLKGQRRSVGGQETTRRRDLGTLNRQIDGEVTVARQRAGRTSGLLIRIDALEQLARDRTPFGDETKTPQSGLLGLTTLGIVVWTVRLWLVLLDVMPVTFKLILSLRRRRPYDALVAENEELVVTEVAEHVDEAYQNLEAAMERHAANRELAQESLRIEVGVPVAERRSLAVVGPSGSRFLEAGQRGSVGRHPECTLVLDDERIGLVHLTISYQPTVGWAVEDQSRGRTYCDGVPVDHVEVDGNGPVELRLAEADGPAVSVGLATGDWYKQPSGLRRDRHRPPAPGSFQRFWPLANVLTIGRAPDNDIVLDEDPKVSRHHAELRRADGGVEIKDLRSRHGVYVDGMQVATAPLSEGAIIGIGRHQFVVRRDKLEEYVDDAVVLAAENLAVVVGAAQMTRLERLWHRTAGALRHAPIADGGPKTLLEGISFTVEPGQLLAIVGSSGAGKTTLLRALLGALPATEGRITYNGRDLQESLDELRDRIGYVPQDNILHSQLRLRTALAYSAELRFGETISPAERDKLIDDVLEDLDLREQARTPIHQLSGGERKRTSVAPELLSRPALLFLDEPTSGLDPDVEREVMELLRRMADQGSTIVVITHATSVLKLCDRVLVVGRHGRMAFYGDPDEAHAFFEAANWADVYEKLKDRPEDSDVDWPARFKGSRAYRTYVAEPARRHRPSSRIRSLTRPGRTRRLLAISRQVTTLTRRSFAVIVATPGSRGYAALLVAQAPVMAGLLALALGGSNLSGHLGRHPRILLVLLVVAALAMGLVNACREIVRELPIYRRERTVGLSRGAYLTSKFLCLGTLAVGQTAVLTVGVIAWQRGPADALELGSPPVELGTILFGATLAAVALGLAVSALAKTDAAAQVMIPVLLVAQIVLCNALLDIADRPVLAQTAWAAPAYWAFSATAASADLLTLEPQCTPGKTAVPPPPPGSADVVCSSRWKHTPSRLFDALAWLAALTAGYAAVAALALRRRDSVPI